MTNDQIYNQGWWSAIKQLGTVAELCPFHYNTPDFSLWVRGYNNGEQERLIREGKAYRRKDMFVIKPKSLWPSAFEA